MRIGRVVDLSRRVEPGMQVYPGDPGVRFEPAATLEEDGVNVLGICMGSHSGTHVDAPYHFIAGGARVDELDPGLFVGPAVVLDFRGKGPRERTTAGDLGPYRNRLSRDVIAVVRTGWEEHYGTPLYYDHPFLDPGAARMLIEAGVRTVAIDALSVDETVAEGPHPEGYPAHRIILGAGGVIAENLANLGALDFPDPFVSLLPIRLGEADGAPVRAVALELTPGS
ncbi:Kynurenine formamidase [Rubrobacter xylanophilus DSM 9941]|uniref:cyclase family protein n=1 Tax=Rubrobacter xylanophilus TaxID=49319 RepID=UPI001C63C25A|nr:cyclase family protein [Rubrobacter xylanophilus]QYJ15942.1 Kynurenine formamidase [Rubrobacter xylanophilus DSM 9941]